MGFELTTLVVIGTDCTGGCKFNYYMITTTTALQQDGDVIKSSIYILQTFTNLKYLLKYRTKKNVKTFWAIGKLSLKLSYQNWLEFWLLELNKIYYHTDDNEIPKIFVLNNNNVNLKIIKLIFPLLSCIRHFSKGVLLPA
jgi:hypothetical protein